MDFEPDYVTLQTDGIVVSACQSLFGQADDESACGYCLRIENNSADKIQILSKTLNITDNKGNSYAECGIGFKGEIPCLEPGEYFEFESSASLKASSAVLYGSCRIIDETRNKTKDIKIPLLELFSNKPSIVLAC